MTTFEDWKAAQPEWVLDMLSDQMHEFWVAGWEDGFAVGKAEVSDSQSSYNEGYDQGYQDAVDIYSMEDY